jgi:hypothetical protein
MGMAKTRRPIIQATLGTNSTRFIEDLLIEVLVVCPLAYSNIPF